MRKRVFVGVFVCMFMRVFVHTNTRTHTHTHTRHLHVQDRIESNECYTHTRAKLACVACLIIRRLHLLLENREKLAPRSTRGLAANPLTRALQHRQNLRVDL
jgi:hypothetical protein